MKQWLSPQTVQLIRRKRILYRRLRKKATPTLLHKYKKLRNRVRNLTRSDYYNYADDVSSAVYTNPKLFWKWIQTSRGCRHPIPPLNHAGSIITSDSQRATIFNEYFSSVFTRETDTDWAKLMEKFLSSNNQARISMNFSSVSATDVFEVLSQLNGNKACGPDGICPRLLKEGAEELSPSLSDIFNKSLRDGVLPVDWTSANIT